MSAEQLPSDDESAQPHLTVVRRDDQPGAELAVRSTTSLRDKLVYADELSKSGLLPAAYRRNPANVLYAVEWGAMLGLSPMAALNGVHIIEGRPTASSALISALVRRAGHRLRVTGDDQRAVAEIVRADDPDFTFRSEWTIDRARAAGIAGKQVWKSYPAAMLKARAITECARDACQEALSGLQYTPEELGASVDGDGNVLDVELVDNNPGSTVADVDWDAKIAEIVDDPDALTLLWKSAPRHSEARVKIAAAGSAAAARRKAAKDEPDADGAVEAELVDPEPAPDLNALAVQVFDALIVLALPEHVDQVTAADITGQPVAQVDVSGLLTQDDREALDLEAATLTLADLAGRLRSYTERHSMSPRQATLPV